jgi:serine/threonine protein kinase
MIGETLGSYKIMSEIGSGGMGVVYLAEHTVLGRKAALKLIRSDVPKEYVERFLNEAKAAASLDHQGLVDVFDFGHHADGRAFIVMEYLQGESLAERLEHDPRLPVPVACAIARTVALSLEVAHKQGIVHRDLKPGNIYLVPDAEAPTGVRTKVLDFGIAKLQRDRDGKGVNTQSGAVIGTPRYMSPEQCKNAKNVDGRSDIYSLGCILYEMLLGVAPFDYDSWAELVGAHIYEEPPKPTEIEPKLPADVETLVCKMLEKDPDDRFSSMQQLAESLEVLLREHGAAPVRLTPPGRMSTPPKGMRKVDNFADPTLPASSRELEAIKSRPPSGRVGTDPTVNATTGEKPADKKRVPIVPLAIAGVGVIALAIAGALVLNKSDEKTSDDQTYVVVDKRDETGSAVEKVVETRPDAAVAEVTIDAGTKTVVKKPEDLASQLTARFAQQNGAIRACAQKHPTTVEGQVSVRFQVDASGSVTSAEVQPAGFANTPLGTCIHGVAMRTKFGAQTKSLGFSAPILGLN